MAHSFKWIGNLQLSAIIALAVAARIAAGGYSERHTAMEVEACVELPALSQPLGSAPIGKGIAKEAGEGVTHVIIGVAILGALVVGILAVRESPSLAAGPAMLADKSAGAAQPDTSQVMQSGTQSGATVQLSPSEITAAGVKVAEVRTAILKTDIAAFGRVEQPEAQLAAVSARIGGRVDKLYVQYTGERVRRGQAVADLYSPEVATSLDEYRLAE